MSANSILAKMAVEISARNAGFGQIMKQNSAQLKSFQATVNNVNNTLRAFGLGFGIYELARGITKAIEISADFEKTMSEVKAITQTTGDDFKALEDDALRLGASTKYTATQVGQLQVAYGRLGFTNKEILAATEATLNLAAATGEDLAKAADVAGSTVRGFELNAAETTRVTDVMASSFNKTALGLENFTESMKYVAPVGHAAGASVEEVTALLGVLADSGIRGSMAGTSLRKIFTDMTRDGRPLLERLAELGKKGITLADSFDEVGRTAQTSLLILTKNTDKINNLTTAFRGANGEAAEMARIMNDNLTGDFIKFTSAVEGLILKFENNSALREVVESLTQLVHLFSGGDDISKRLGDIAESIKDFGSPTVAQLKHLKDLRRELGRPIDTKQVDGLAERYKLTDREATKLYATIIEANKALSFQEQTLKDFNNFASENEGKYKDQSTAIEAYTQTLYESIVAKQTQQDLFRNEPDWVKLYQGQIDALFRAIRILSEYKDTLKEVNTEIEKTFPKFIRPEVDRKRIGKLNDPDSFLNDGPSSSLDPFLGIDPNEPLNGLVKEIEYNDEIATQLANLNKLREEQLDKMRATAEMAETLGMAVGDAFNQMINGEQNFAQALASITEQIISLYLRQSIASMIKNSIEAGGPIPFAGIALAAAGIGAVKGLFGQIGGNNTGGGSGQVGRTPSQMSQVTGRSFVRAYTIETVLSKGGSSRRRMG